ncbi:hypothetical protein ABB26_05500 [Stenotrophomonas humi]|uniref:Pyrrolo-quinoline quinone repeat domain-containing protein n=1 Tax=Stenotrophomonas humi TaxID=405444 RepID=A0A0R0CIH0_9GAMM|nr:PQQ-binding-like beta-propeller repeat protein [Stenotrophomonas humi]KRG64995.1 hypothetical protein ABB26_05500 [Stenotrophomonas humi]
MSNDNATSIASLRAHRPWWLMLAASALSVSTALAAAEPDLSGYWLGDIGSKRERVVMGLELQADINGRYDMKLDLPVSHLQALPLHGKASIESDTLVHDGLHMSLRHNGERLTGTLFGNGESVSLERANRGHLPLPATPPKDLPTLPGPHWTTRLSGQIFASPVIHDDIVYVGTTGGTFSAVNLADGNLRWSSAIGHPILGAALVTDEAAFVVSDGGYLHRLERSTGREQWRASIEDSRTSRELPHPQSSAWEWQAPRPLLVDGVLYVGGSDGCVQAFAAATGASIWRTQLPGRIQHGLSFVDGTLHVATEPGELHALHARSGRKAWTYPLSMRPGSAPVVHNGRVFINDRSGVLHAVDARSGRALWLTQFWTSWIESEPSFDNETLYIGASDLRKITAIDTATGRVRWRTDVGGWSWGTPLVVNDHLIVGTAAGQPYFLQHVAGISVIRRDDGVLVSHYPLPPGRGFQWGIAGSITGDAQMLVAADIEGVLMGFELDAMIRNSSMSSISTTHTP